MVPAPRAAAVISPDPAARSFNQAVACARSHAATTLLVALGNDAAAQHARALTTGFGIDFVDEVHADVATGSAGIFVDARGRNVIVVALGANAVLSTGFVDAEMARLRAAAVTLAQLEVDRDAAFRRLAIAPQAGRRTILNPAPADAPVDEALLELADLITPNETEFAALCLRILGEQVVADAVATMPSVELHALCRRLHKGSVVITLGSAGCFVSHADAATFNDAGPELLARDRAAALRIVEVAVAHGVPFGESSRASIAAAARDPAWCARLREHSEAGPSFLRLLTDPRPARLRTSRTEAVSATPDNPERLLAELHDLGLLLAMIPEFAAVTSKVQHDVYHVYTVDVHSVAAVDRLHALARGELGEDFALATKLLPDTDRRDVLCLATLLHDVGKARGRQHAQVGAEWRPTSRDASA